MRYQGRRLRSLLPRGALALYDRVHREARAQAPKEAAEGYVFFRATFGRFFLDLGSDLERLFYRNEGVLEPHLDDLFRCLVHPGDVVLDVGANAGLHSVLFARLAAEASLADPGPRGEVLAFEPVPAMFARLERSAALNRELPIACYRCALSDTNGPATMFVVDPTEEEQGNHALVANEKITGALRGRTKEVPVEAWRLDDFLTAQRPDLDRRRVAFVKIDVEGAELQVLRGMSELLEVAAPHLLIEHDHTRLRALGLEPSAFGFLTALGYRALRVSDEGVLDDYAFTGDQPGRELLLLSTRRSPTLRR